MDREAFGAQSAISFTEQIKIFLFRDATDVKETNFAVAVAAESFEERGIASFWVKEFGVEAARENFQFRRIKPALDPALAIFLRVDEDSIELAVEPVHVTPCNALEETVLGQDADVLRKIGMINPAGLEIEHFRRK